MKDNNMRQIMSGSEEQLNKKVNRFKMFTSQLMSKNYLK